MNKRDVIVIGASAGGIGALTKLCRALPADLPAAIFIVLHIGSHASKLPQILDRAGPLTARHAVDGDIPEHGKIYIAPPDRHMLLQDGKIRLTHGPKENFTRPAIDPLFRSAALSCGDRTIGVIVSGQMDDGVAGLAAIKTCGGLALVQDPADAEMSGMPEAALANVAVDYCEEINMLALRLAALAGQPTSGEKINTPQSLLVEHLASLGEGTMADRLEIVGKRSLLVCPECSGTLWELNDGSPPRYRCHTGHSYTLQGLSHYQAESVEAALWTAIRAMQDLAVIKRKEAEASAQTEGGQQAPAFLADAELLSRQATQIQRLLEKGDAVDTDA